MIENKIIYISHPYSGLEENKNKVSSIVLSLMNKYPNYLFISPIHAFGFAYNDLSYEKGLDYCLKTLKLSDEMWVFGDYENSIGCNKEIEYCRNNNIPYTTYG